MIKADSPTSFPETRWSVILDARAKGDEVRASRALQEVCASYWRPLYAYARMLGNPPQDSEDLTQSFFERFLEYDLISNVCAERGRMRTYLLSCFVNHVRNIHREKLAQRRGGGITPLPMTGILEVEREIDVSASLALSPDQIYDRQCALALVDDVLREIESEQTKAGRGDIFQALKPLLDPNATQMCSLEEIAMELGISNGALRGAVMRLRRRFREIARSLVSQTLHSPSDQEIDEELMWLRQSLE